MKRAATIVLALVLGCVSRADAASFTYDLTCPFGGDPTQPECGGFNYGTITFADGAADTVNVTVDLSNDSWTIGEIDWNITSALALVYNDPNLADAETFNDGSVLDDVQADGYTPPSFDIGLNPPPGPPYPDPYSFSVTGTGLTASMFNTLDAGGLVFAAVHIQSCGADDENCPNGSIWVGAETSGDTPGGDTPGGDTPGGDTPGGTPGGADPAGDTPGGDTPGGTPGGADPAGAPVPEPASLALLGSGLAIAASRLRRKRA